MEASHVDDCDVVFRERSEDGPPSVALVRRDGEGSPLRASAEQMRDGLHCYVTPYPGESAGSLHLALRRTPTRMAKMSVTAGLAAALALRFHGPLQGVPRNGTVHWLKKAHAQILRAVEKDGGAAFGDVGKGFLDLNRECMHLVDRALNRDVEEAVARVRKEFKVLVDHFGEEDVVTWWREAIVEKTHDH
jgi:hypothetical protein